MTAHPEGLAVFPAGTLNGSEYISFTIMAPSGIFPFRPSSSQFTTPIE